MSQAQHITQLEDLLDEALQDAREWKAQTRALQAQRHELLAALRELLQEVEAGDFADEMDEGIQRRESVRAARAATAKAEGR